MAQTTVVLHRHHYWSPRLISNWMDTGDAFAFLDRILAALGVIAQPFTATTSLPTLTPR
jgi:hypothetical protein